MDLYVATKVLAVRDGKILILRESDTYEEGTNAGKWDVAGGRIAPDEPFRKGLEREVLEESGLKVERPRIIHVEETFPTIKGRECHIVRMYFVADAVPGDVVLSRDHDAFLWIDPREHSAHGLMWDVHDVFDIYLQAQDYFSPHLA